MMGEQPAPPAVGRDYSLRTLQAMWRSELKSAGGFSADKIHVHAHEHALALPGCAAER
jgi:hypothetical protein